MGKNLIGREVTITARNSWAYGELGVIKDFDGELYHVVLWNGDDMYLVFDRSEFRLKRLNKGVSHD